MRPRQAAMEISDFTLISLRSDTLAKCLLRRDTNCRFAKYGQCATRSLMLEAGMPRLAATGCRR